MAAEREAQPMKDSTVLAEWVRKLLRRRAAVPLLFLRPSMGPAADLGAVLPRILRTIHVDTAVATRPFVTIAVDLPGLPPFFGVAGPHLVAQ